NSSRSPERAVSVAVPDAPSKSANEGTAVPAPAVADRGGLRPFGLHDKFCYYLGETYLNPSVVTAPAFRAGLRMANPPTSYPAEWRHGAEAFGRNYGDAFAQRIGFHSARFLTGALLREDPRYIPSTSHNALGRSFHALGYEFFDRS